MSASKYEKDRQKKQELLEEGLVRRVNALRAAIGGELLAKLSDQLTVGKDGKVMFSVANIKRANRSASIVQNTALKRGRKIIKWLVNGLKDLFRLNSNYFSAQRGYPQSVDDRALNKLMLGLGYNVRTGKIIKGGFFSQVFSVESPAMLIAKEVRTSLAARPLLKDFRKSFQKRFKEAGYLEKHFKRFTADLFTQFDSQAQGEIAQDLGLTHFVYSGRLIKTSRCFCGKRQGRIYTTEYAERWNSKDWKGKIDGTSFFVTRGGYNCGHSVSYLTTLRAERMAKQRGFKINSFNSLNCVE